MSRSDSRSVKTCSRCRKTKPTAAFSRARRNKDGLHSWCRQCNAERYRSNCERQKRASQRSRIRREYGIELEEYEALVAEGCRACGGHENVVLDHHHELNVVRWPLCDRCNRTLGIAQEDSKRLRALADLLDTTDVAALPKIVPILGSRSEGLRLAWAEGRSYRLKVDRELVAKLYAGGMGQRKIAKQVGCDVNTVRRCLVEADVPRRIGLYSIEESEFRRLWPTMTSRQMAKHFGCSDQNIMRLARKFGLRRYMKRLEP